MFLWGAVLASGQNRVEVWEAGGEALWVREARGVCRPVGWG